MMRLGVLGVASDLRDRLRGSAQPTVGPGPTWSAVARPLGEREVADVMAEIGPLLTRLDYA
jgi:hypothetical protein